MDITVSVNNIIDESIKCLQNSQPMSLVRIGDGEMIIAENMAIVSAFCERQIARPLNESELKIAQENLITAISNTDLLGIPKPIQIEENWPLKNVYKYISDIKSNTNNQWKKKSYCGNNSHLDLLNSGGIFKILAVPKKICIVSCRDITERIYSRFPNIVDVEYYKIPGEQSFEVVKEKNIDILGIINSISEKIKSKDRSGQLLIYGAGPFGKHLGTEFSSVGGVALDLGSVFDLFVGKVTRGKGKGASIYTTPKL